MKNWMTYQVVLSYRVEVDASGKMIGTPELLKGYVPRHQKKKEEINKELRSKPSESLEL